MDAIISFQDQIQKLPGKPLFLKMRRGSPLSGWLANRMILYKLFQVEKLLKPWAFNQLAISCFRMQK
jgi:hypothetical protein